LNVIEIPFVKRVGIQRTVDGDCAYPLVSDESRTKFNEQLSKNGRALISVKVEVRDTEGTVTCTGTYNWFVQKMN